MLIGRNTLDPQQWNRYAYVRNNPLRYVDPTGEKIELLGDEKSRRFALDALREMVGEEAGSLLYERTEVDGSETRFFVDIATQTSGLLFEGYNQVAMDLADMIRDSRLITLGVAGPTELLPGSRMSLITSSGITGLFGENEKRLGVYIRSGPYPASVPGRLMSDGRPGLATRGIVLAHELGHAYSRAYGAGRDKSISAALYLENVVRKCTIRMGQLGSASTNRSGIP
jgi:hypothetical protein